ncbi:unnamed protein product [Brassica rapa subsp. trilocularis]
MEKTRVLVVTVIVGMCSESDDLIKTPLDDWDSLVLESKVTVMFMFTATWCGSCGEMSLILD